MCHKKPTVVFQERVDKKINRLKYKDRTVFYRRKNMDFGMRYVNPVALPFTSYETSYLTLSEPQFPHS